MRRTEHIQRFCDTLWLWYAEHKRVLPWRDLSDVDRNAKAYRVLVSEFMLQQTQVPRVIEMYKKFIQNFPDISALSRATNASVIRQWSGLGYNSRALRLRDVTQVIETEYHGVFPATYDTLVALKGIGPYTAAAVLNFAFNQATPCIDTNIRRILHRVFVGPERADGTWRKDDRYLLGLAARVLRIAVDGKRTPSRRHGSIQHTAAEWHAALMDYGSLVGTKRQPKWDQCPLVAAGVQKPYDIVAVRSPCRRAEPGIALHGVFVPRRILRGRLLGCIGGAAEGCTLVELFRDAGCVREQERSYLRGVLEQLAREQMVRRRGDHYML